MSHVLFITRSMQDVPGGMQAFTRMLVAALRERDDCCLTVVAHRGGVLGLPWFVLCAGVRILVFRGSTIHLGDAALAPFLWITRIIRPRVRRTITVHGLDLTWRPWWYQWLLKRCLPLADRVVAVSRATQEEARKRGVMEVMVIPCGIPDNFQFSIFNFQSISTYQCSNTLLLFGRQVRRKGTLWFLTEVAPKLVERHPELCIVVAGDGPMLPAIRAAAQSSVFRDRVAVYGSISEERKDELFATSALFVMPNIRVPGDMEGFGIVCIEASAAGLPVVAARLEGIADAVIEGETGMFFDPENAHGAALAIDSALQHAWDSDAVRAATLAYFDVATIASRYVQYVFS